MSYINSFIKDCHRNLFDGSLSSNLAKEYLIKERGLNEEFIRKYELGTLSDSARIPDQIRHFGEKTEDENSNYEGAKDFYYKILNKIIVPIHDEFGKLIAFSTRSYREDGTTWWNVPFAKGNHLFLFNMSKKSAFDKNKIYIVEGYMDALLMYQFGITNVAAIMGTNLSLRQLALIIRYCNNVCFCFDSDENSSGQKALNKTISMVNKFKTFDEISVINLPMKVDPDKYIIENGKDKFLALEEILTQKQIKDICKKQK